MEEKWLEDAKAGNLKDMKEICQRLRSHGLLQEVKRFKDSDGDTALSLATIKGHLDICQFLVREDLVDVNNRNVIGFNALHNAAIKNRPEIAKWLLEETSIDVNEQDDCGYTALHWVVDCNCLEITRILLKYKPRNLKNERGETALDGARKHNNEEIIQLLKRHYNI